MKERMRNPTEIRPDAMQALLALLKSVEKVGVPSGTFDLVWLRASQINGCSLCLDMHARDARREGETDERLFAVAAWRDSPYFNDAERAALALTEASLGSGTGPIRSLTRYGPRPPGTSTKRHSWR